MIEYPALLAGIFLGIMLTVAVIGWAERRR